MRKAVIPLGPADTSVFAYTTRVSASGPLVIHILEPFKIYRSFRFSALRLIETTSDPDPCSDIAKAPTRFPEIRSGK